jgi:hypothetical protein
MMKNMIMDVTMWCVLSLMPDSFTQGESINRAVPPGGGVEGVTPPKKVKKGGPTCGEGALTW